MNDIMIKMLLDVSVAGLLCATIFFCTKLNTRIKILQDSKSDLAQLIAQFDEATRNAVTSIQEIHRASRKIGENIQAKLDKANYLANDLEFMIERANKTTDKIEKQITDGRGSSAPTAATNRVTTTNNPNNPNPRNEQKLDEVISRASSPQKPNEKRGIEAMMDRISELKGSKPANSDEKSGGAMRPMARMRSKAEQDLMQALKKDK